MNATSCGLSTGARISPSEFVNSYDRGDFRGDPDRLMDDFFDLFLYYANWGSRRISIRFPATSVPREVLDRLPGEGETIQGG